MCWFITGTRRLLVYGATEFGLGLTKVAFQMLQGVEQRIAALVGEPRHGLFLDLAREGADLLHHGLGLGGQVELDGAPVGGVVAALHQPRFLQPVDQAAERDRLDLEDFGERRLADALVARELRNRAPLGLGEAERLGAAVEAAPHQPRHIVHQEAEAAFRVVGEVQGMVSI